MPQNNIDVILRLLNGRRFQAQMYAAGRSARAFGTEMQAAASASTGLSTAANAASGSMYAVGAASRVAALAVGVSMATIVGAGVSFNATMESNTLALDHFAGGAKEADRLAKSLFKTAAETPFSFEDITTAARRFLAFGFSVDETNKLLQTMGDTLSLTGGSTDEILRMAKAFGDIRSKGRLMQQELLQLTNLNLPIYEILTEDMGLTEQELKNVGRAGIDAETAIAGLAGGLDKRFGGGRLKYMETFNGQLQRLVDNFKMASGTATTGIFAFLKDGLKALNDALEGNTSLGQKFKDIGNSIIGVLKDIWPVISDAVVMFMDAIKPATPFLENVLWPLIKGLAIGLGVSLAGAFIVVVGIIKIVATALGWLGEKLEPLGKVFEFVGMVVSLLFGGAILKAISSLRYLGVVASVLAVPLRIAGVVFKGLGAGIAWVFGHVGRLIGRMTGLTGVFKSGIGAVRNFANTIRTSVSNAFLWVTSRMGSFGDKVFDFAVGLKDKFATGLKGIGQAILGAFASAVAFFGSLGTGIKNWLNDNTILGDRVSMPGPLPDFDMPALASGGYITSAGSVLVGERGPEILNLPLGANVTPMRGATVARNTPMGARTPQQGFEAVKVAVHAPVYLDRRQVGEAMGDYVAIKKARR